MPKEEPQKTAGLQRELLALEEQRNKLNTEARKWAEKRNKLNEKIKNLRTEIHEVRSARDKLNMKVAELKQLRENTKIEIYKAIEQIRQLNQQIKALAKKKPSNSLQTLQDRLDAMEWKIQTTPLSLQEEKELVEQVGKLETQINVHKKLQIAHQERLELQTKLKTNETRNKSYHEELTENAQKSREVHAEMLEKINKLRELEMEAENMHQSFLKTRQKIKPIQREIAGIISQLELSKEEIRKEEDKEKRKSEESLRQKIQKSAREKLKRGEKITWQEFQILTEKKKATQD